MTDRSAPSPSPDADPILVHREDAVLTVTINRPHRKNALDIEAFSGLRRAFDTVARDESVHVVVLTGAGGDFCAGADLDALEQKGHPLHRMRWAGGIIEALHHLPQPTIAKVEGVAVGGGCSLALACDLVVARADARFSQIFARRGLSVDMGGSWVLPRVVGLQQAKRLAFLGEIIDAEEALAVGLATWVKKPGEIDDFVADLARRLATGPPVALALSKALLNEASSQTLHEAVESEARAQLVNFATDLPAAKQAFLNRSEPVFEGLWQV